MSFPIRGSVWLGLATFALLIAGAGGWAVTTRIEGAVIAQGEVQLPEDRQRVQHPEGGVVAAIAVTEGQAVQAGDLLMRLDGADLRSELAIVEGQVHEVDARIARLEAERDGAETLTLPAELALASQPEVVRAVAGQRTLFSARAATLAGQRDQLAQRQRQVEDEIAGIRAQRDASHRQLDLVVEELADQRHLLERGLTQRQRVRSLEREEARLQGEIGRLVAVEAEAQGRIAEYRMQDLSLTATRREEVITQLRDLSHQRAELAERQQALGGKIARLDIRAPVSGRVLGLAVTPQGVLRPADTALVLIPQDGPLIVQARIPPLNVDEVRAGQTVRLVLPAFPAHTAPEMEGRVLQVTPDALEAKDGSRFYIARIALEAAPDLTPGMPVEAFIRTGARSPLAYLLHPVAAYFDRAFRET